ncbi:MAG: hypothetical protein IJC38_04075 [Erysipelotrichaceae bacterium]|nr:hypothetical protein [Erysipelotrichaceae bacterium]
MKLVSKIIIAAAACLGACLALAGCLRNQYHIEYGSTHHLFKNAKDSYPAGSKVILYTSLPKTYPDVFFTLNHQKLDFFYDEHEGFYLSFVMPNHDILLRLGLDESNSHQSVLLANYFEKSMGTDETNSYEIVLMTSSENDKIVVEKYCTSNKSQTCSKYLVDSSILDQCYSICQSYKTSQWSDCTDLTSMDGKMMVFKYYDKGQLIRITSDEMPEKGNDFFSDIRFVLNEALSDSDKSNDEDLID